MSPDPAALPAWIGAMAARGNGPSRRALLSAMAAAVRQGQARRIRAQEDPDGSDFEPRKPRHRPPRKTGPLFKRAPGRLRTEVSDTEARIGWGGRVAEVLRIHQEGLLGRVGRSGPVYQYPRRRLLGLSADDLLRLEQIALQRLAGVGAQGGSAQRIHQNPLL